MYKFFDETSWASHLQEQWQDLLAERWGGSGIRLELTAEFMATGLVQKRAGVTFDLPAEVFVANVGSTTNFYDLLLWQLPDYERESAINKAAMRGIAAILAYLEAMLIKIDQEQELSTGVEMLKRWEALFGLKAQGKTPEERREAVRTSLRAKKNVVRYEDVLALLRTYVGDASIEKLPGPHGSYRLKLGCSRPPNGDDLERDLNKLTNASYVWQLEFIQNAWQDLSTKTWQQASSLKWVDAKEGVI